MSKAEKVSELSFENIPSKLATHKFEVTWEIVALYVVGVLTVIAFFESLKTLFYTILGYLAFILFLSLMLYVIFYVIYNFSVIFYELFLRKPHKK